METTMGTLRTMVDSIGPRLGLTLLAIALSFYFYFAYQYKYFKRLGLRNPPPVPPLGNLLPILTRDRMLLEREWRAKYGKLYGFYEGVRRRIVVADAELLRQICIKDFDMFPNHDLSPFLNEYQRNFIIFKQDDVWKRVRALQSPTFTSGKIKRMFRLLDRCANDLVECFEEQLRETGKGTGTGRVKTSPPGGATVNLKEIFSLFTMDAIATCGYGLKLERAGSASIKSAASRNDFIRLALRLFDLNIPRIIFFFAMPMWLLRPLGFRVMPEREVEPLAARVRHIIKQRKGSNMRHDDYLQILLDARLDDQMELNEMDNKENHHAGLTRDTLLADQSSMVAASKGNEASQLEAETGARAAGTENGTGQANGQSSASLDAQPKASLSQEEVLSSAMFLLVVGLETTATLLTHCSYALAFHLEIQERLYLEIKSIARPSADGPEQGSFVFDYEALTSCQYLDAVISETLRLLSPVLALDRIAKFDYRVDKYDVTIPAGTKLNLAYHAIMTDPEYWPEPERFDPERFMPNQRENIVPGSYCPFGIGPRHCLGMRFSLTETKLALAKVLMRYKFLPAEGTVFPPSARRGMGLNVLKDPRARIELRAN